MDRRLVTIVALVAVVTGLMVGLYWYNLMLSSSLLPPVEEEPPQILSHTSFVEGDSSRFLMIEGEVRNNLKTSVDVNVTATLYDAKGNLLGNVTRRAMLKTLRSGQKSPFILVWPLNSSTVPTCKLSLSYSRVYEEPQAVLEVSYHANGTDENGYYIITGKVWNKGDGNAIIVSVICTYYDSAGNVTRICLASVPSVNAGSEAFFELSSAPYRMSPAGYGLAVVASRYERPFIQNYALLIVLILVLAIFVIYLKRRGW